MDPRDYLKNGIAKTKILNPNSRFIICSYFWGKNNVNKNSIKGMTYGQQSDRLIENCEKLKLNYNIVEYPVFAEKKLYQLALGLKGEFIMKCLKEFPKYNVIFLDADLQILQYPHLFEIDADCFFLNWNEYDFNCYNPYQLELPGGILGFGNTNNGRTLLSLLNKHMLKHLHLAEDKSFSGIITRHFMNTYLRCVWIPYNYMYMFQNHKYDPKIGKYTKIVDLKQDLVDEDYRVKDIVIIHEDFETGALEDVFKQRVGKNRFPSNLYKQLGEKLRCQKITYRNYVNFNLTPEQLQHYKVDYKEKQNENIYINTKLKKIKDIKLPFVKHIDLENNISQPIIVSLVDRNTPLETISQFRKSCKNFNFNYIIFETQQNISKPDFFYKIMEKYKHSICYIDIHYHIKKNPVLLNTKNMDFMTINLNNTHIVNRLCSDIRILKTLNDNLYYFAYNNVTMQFLQIWSEFNKNLTNQHKNLEYAFNISLAINKMRCFWLPKQYIIGPVLHYDKKYISSFFNNVYDNDEVRQLTDSLAQCGIKPPLRDGDPTSEHYRGSKYGTIYHNRYGKLFL